MSKYYYKKKDRKNFKKILKIIALCVSFFGVSTFFYVSFPLISWQVYFSTAFASQEISAPIPKTNIVNSSSVKNLVSQEKNNLSDIDYSNAQNWFPDFKPNQTGIPKISEYSLSIPKLKIKDVIVSAIDNNLDTHLVNYQGTAIPPDKGNAVIYGHSTLPQLFNQKDYKTIFATLHNLKTGDEFSVNVLGVSYLYKIFKITIVDPSDTSIFSQDYNDSYITLVTCTPPGTIWKRLIIKARLEKI
ncbi:MAG: sortase [Candidatus Levybacteria bacterium]|nr:sortase [Candidatus Levybacteria bacterium]